MVSSGRESCEDIGVGHSGLELVALMRILVIYFIFHSWLLFMPFHAISCHFMPFLFSVPC